MDYKFYNMTCILLKRNFSRGVVMAYYTDVHTLVIDR